jgi:hypothetical protein
MPLTCNINARGRAVRLVYGIVLIVAAIVVAALWARPTGSVWMWIISGASFVGGAFAVFEARAGWCVVRAMGFKTKM